MFPYGTCDFLIMNTIQSMLAKLKSLILKGIYIFPLILLNQSTILPPWFFDSIVVYIEIWTICAFLIKWRKSEILSKKCKFNMDGHCVRWVLMMIHKFAIQISVNFLFYTYSLDFLLYFAKTQIVYEIKHFYWNAH